MAQDRDPWRDVVKTKLTYWFYKSGGYLDQLGSLINLRWPSVHSVSYFQESAVGHRRNLLPVSNFTVARDSTGLISLFSNNVNNRVQKFVDDKYIYY